MITVRVPADVYRQIAEGRLCFRMIDSPSVPAIGETVCFAPDDDSGRPSAGGQLSRRVTYVDHKDSGILKGLTAIGFD